MGSDNNTMLNKTDDIFNNITLSEISDDTQLFSKIVIGIYFTVLFVGCCVNLCLIISLLLQKKQGTTYIILQFAFIDILSIWVATTEIWSLYNETWTFNSILCPLFLGNEVLINVIIIYMHILLNFHAISAWNMQKNNEAINKNPLTNDTDESNECLVWSENSIPNRTMNIDYRHKRNSVSIILPSMLIWFTCLSLSIPEFTLSTTVEYHTNRTLCTIVDLHYTKLLQYLLVFFRDVIPTPLLILTFVIALYKLCNSTSLSNVKKNSSAKKFIELKKLLQLSIILSMLYVLSSFHRSIILCLHTIFHQFDTSSVEHFKMPPLDNIIVNNFTNMYLSMIHYSTILLRPLCCIVIMPSTIIMMKDCVIKSKERNQ